MARTWNDMKYGYFKVENESDEMRISEGYSMRSSPAPGIQNSLRAMTPNSGTRGNFIRNTPSPSGIQNVYRPSVSRGIAKKDQGLVFFSWITSKPVFILSLLHHLNLYADSWVLSRNLTTKLFLFSLPVALLLAWKSDIFMSVAHVQHSKNGITPQENDVMSTEKNNEDNEQSNQWKAELEKKIQIILENKWQELSKQFEGKWIHKFNQVELLQKKLFNQVEATVKEVNQLKDKIQSIPGEKEGMNESSVLENLTNVMARLDQSEEKNKDLESILLHFKSCKDQADLNRQLRSQVQNLQANFSHLLDLRKSISTNSFSHLEHVPSINDIKKIVQVALRNYDSDKTGLVDYALESAGGSIVSVRSTETYAHGSTQFTIFGLPFWKSSNSPRAVIQPRVHPGECWAMRGSQGKLVIRLFASIQPSSFSLEHIPKNLAPMGKIDSAPKEFSVFGLHSDYDEEGIFFGNYTYLDDGESLQTFDVQNLQDMTFILIELRVHSNHGNSDYTCIYRFRVHGIQK